MLMRIALPALALAAAAPAAAEPVSVAVSYGDLDLTRDAGRQLLEHRLDRAVRKICGVRAPIRELARMSAWKECVAEARSSYRDQVELALNVANARRVARLDEKIAVFTTY